MTVDRNLEADFQAGQRAGKTAPSSTREHDAASESPLDYIIRRLRETAKETPEEYAQRWPYNSKVEIEAADARLLLEALDAKR